LALYNVDAVLHNTIFDKSEPLMDYMKSRIQNVIDGLKAPQMADMTIYKLYNDGFIVRTKSVTVAFDLVMGSTYQLIPDELMAQLVDLCDIMFLSHNHRDHVDPGVVKMFTDRGKQVVGPDEALPDNMEMTHFRKEQIADLNITLPNSKLKIKVLPGHQDELQNNIYVITTPENLTFAQTGDQYHREDIPWIATVKNHIPKVDVLLINCWAMELKTHVDGFNPELVITGHENEMGHTIDHREAYWMSYLKLDELEYPYSLMTWGECYDFNKK
jgi:L-ascorbate metabolism protein UlaG (beta-lactamase superfamily)